MSLFRVLVTTPITLSRVFEVDEVPTDAAGNVDVAVKRLDGTSLQTGVASDQPGPGAYGFTVNPRLVVDTLTVDWTGTFSGVPVTVRDIVEVVGGHIFGLSDARNTLKNIKDKSRYPSATLAARRIGVEQECEYISGQAWVPRFGRFLLDGTGTDELVVPDMFVRAVRSAKVAETTGATFVDLTAAQLAAIAVPAPSGVLGRGDGDVWPRGRSNVLVEYEYGHDYPREDIKDAAMLRLQSRLGMVNTGVPDRAVTFTVADGGVYRLTTAGPKTTGIPEVDAAYQRDATLKLWIAS